MTELGEQMAEILAEFTAESREHVDAFEAAMLQLERDPDEGGATAAAFRAMHSIKGNASFLALEPFEALTHAGETVLGRIRGGELRAEGSVIDALLSLVDLLRAMIDRLAALEPGASFEASEVGPALRTLAPYLSGAGAGVIAALSEGDDEPEPTGLVKAASKIRVDVGLLDRLMNLVGELVLARNQILQHAGDGQLDAVQVTAQRLDQVTTSLQEAVMKTRMQPVGTTWTRFPRVVRDLCAELGKRARVVLEGRETELDKQIVEALHDPLTHLLRNAVDHGVETPERRVAAGKPREATIRIRGFHEGGLVNLEISDDGAGIDAQAVRARARQIGWSEAQLDALDERALLELVFAPGFSTRLEAGKLSGRGVGLDVVRTNIERLGGRIELRSRLGEGTTVRIEIPLTLAIIPALIVTCAGERFAIPQANLLEIVRLDDEQEQEHAHVHVHARAREHERERETSGRRLEQVHGATVLRLRGRLLPLAELRRLLGLGVDDPHTPATTVIVLQAESQRYGLVVEAIHDTEEIVVKPLWSQLDALGCYAGATVLGDGRIALILDSVGLAGRAGVLNDETEDEDERIALGLDRAAERSREALTEAAARQQLLLCRAAGSEQLAIALAEVARLEEIDAGRIERMGAQEVIQHNHEIVPLVRLARLLAAGDPASEARPELGARLQLIIHRIDGRPVGLIVDELLDIIEVEAALQRPASRPGIRGSLVVGGRVTELLDVAAAIRLGVPGFFDSTTQGWQPGPQRGGPP